MLVFRLNFARDLFSISSLPTMANTLHLTLLFTALVTTLAQGQDMSAVFAKVKIAAQTHSTTRRAHTIYSASPANGSQFFPASLAPAVEDLLGVHKGRLWLVPDQAALRRLCQQGVRRRPQLCRRLL